MKDVVPQEFIFANLKYHNILNWFRQVYVESNEEIYNIEIRIIKITTLS